MKLSNEKVTTFLKEIQTTFPDEAKTVEKIKKIFFDENSEI
jgi:hypothetical protein